MPPELNTLLNCILDVYDRVASGQTHGAGGSFYADGKGTLNGVNIDVSLLEALAEQMGRKVWGRTNQDRNRG